MRTKYAGSTKDNSITYKFQNVQREAVLISSLKLVFYLKNDRYTIKTKGISAIRAEVIRRY